MAVSRRNALLLSLLVALVCAHHHVLISASAEAFSLPLVSRSRRATTSTKYLDLTPHPSASFSPHALKSALNLSGGGGSEAEAVEASSSSNNLKRELLAEAIGTYIIIQIGGGVNCAATYLGAQVGLWQIAVVWSIAVTLAISTTAAISGAHLNPAISFALALLRPSKAFGWGKFFPFVMAQIVGAAVAGGINFALFREAAAAFEASNNIVRGTAESVASACTFGEYWSVSSWKTAFLAEALGTGLLAFVVFALTNSKNDTTSKNSLLVPPLIGATVGGLISFIAPLTQAGLNPARDFGPRIVVLFAGWGKTVAMKGAWLYILAPLVGAPIGALLADKVLYGGDEE